MAKLSAANDVPYSAVNLDTTTVALAATQKAEKAEERTEKAEKKRLLQLANETKAEKRLREKAEAEKKKAKAEKKKESLFAAQFRKSFRKGKKSV